MKLIFTIIVFILTFVRYSFSHDFKDCGSTTFSTTKVTISPDPGKIGKDLTVEINGNLSGEIYPETIETTIQYGSIPYTMTDKYCDLDTSKCTTMSNITLEKTMEIPTFVMKGTYDTKVVIYDKDKSIDGCIIASVSVVR